jgi:glycogen debranching enzyme
MMRGTLPELARWQGKEHNDWRDEQPGRMLHEAHTGPLETLNFNPRGRYYGSITTSGFYPVVVSELWHWTGDRELVGSLIEPMLSSLEWLDRYGDLDGDGFYEYQSRSIQGSQHQAWKDSRDAIVDETGRFVQPPIATCEEQGFAYIAKLHASEVLWWFDRKEEARQLYGQAGKLKEHLNEAFWMPDQGFFAMGLDSKKKPIKAIGSNPGHLLATGIAAEEYVPQTVERLFRPDLFTGWGIRTLSSANPAFNPFSYHRGSVWPVEHGTFALGFMRYGLHDAVEKISFSQFQAAALFEHYRLPEVFTGHALDGEHPFPALYAQSNAPQAWSSSSLFCLIQSLLGLYPYAPLNLLLVDPHLPAWLPEITLEGLRVGKNRVTIHFYRIGEETSDYRILDVEGNIHVIRQPSPWSLTASFGERLRDFLLSLLTGM